MAIASARDFEKSLPRSLAGSRLIVLYGDNFQAKLDLFRLVRKALSIEPDDPFRLVQLDGDTINSDPARLADEIGAISMFGGIRLIRAIVPARQIDNVLNQARGAPPGEWLLVVDVEDLDPSRISSLKGAADVSLVACGSDNPGDFRSFVELELERSGLRLGENVLEYLIPLLGEDRAAARGELEKLSLLADSSRTISLDELKRVAADGTSVLSDEVAVAALSGNLSALAAALDRLQSTGADATGALGAASRLALNLYRSKTNQWRSQSDQIIGNLTAAELRSITRLLQLAVLQARSDGANAQLLAERALISLGYSAKTRKR